MVAGESYLPCIDAFYDHRGVIEPVVCRQESGAVYMAEAYGKLTGEPGVCFVTRGPGATNASVGVQCHTSLNIILFMQSSIGRFSFFFMKPKESFNVMAAKMAN